MPKKGHTEEQIVAVLRQAEAGEKVSGSLSEGGDQRSDLLCLEETVRRAGSERVAGVTAVAG